MTLIAIGFVIIGVITSFIIDFVNSVHGTEGDHYEGANEVDFEFDDEKKDDYRLR